MRTVRTITVVVSVLLKVLCLSHAENIVALESKKDAIFQVDPKFLSVTFDSSGIIANPQLAVPKPILYKFKNEKLRKLVRHLSPAYFRVGGTMADTIIFYPSNDAEEDYPNVEYSYPINETTLFDLTEATDSMGVELIFDLAAGLLRKDDDSWDSRNAEKILKFCDDNNLNISRWELGNEPDLFIYISQLPNIKKFNGTQIGKDSLVLRQMLDNTKNYKSTSLNGPGVFWTNSGSGANPYLRDFLAVAGEMVGAITWHHYYFNSANAKAETFLDPTVFSELEGLIQIALDVIKELNLDHKEKWLGETSSTYGGGAINLSDRFLASFLWLDKLGVSARMGLSVVTRQTIITGGYTLIDTETDEENPTPNPDWWVSVLFKKVVGTKVLALNSSTADTVRLYAHCATESFGKGSVTVFGVNFENATAIVNIEGLTNSNGPLSVEVFELTSGSDSTLETKDIKLNGKLLQVSSDYDLPDLTGKVMDITQSSSLTMPAYSNVFWVISGAEIQACSS